MDQDQLASVLKIKRSSGFILICLALFFLMSQDTFSSLRDDNSKPFTVVIDPGHGGRDPGAVGQNIYEKDVVLPISLKVREYISEYLPDVRVIFTREKDEFVEIHRRAEIANSAGADLFISVHANSNRNRRIQGTETYAMGLHTSKENLEVARKENAVIFKEDDYDEQYDGFDPTSEESYIIFSLMQNTYLAQSLNFASMLQDEFRSRARRVDRGVKQAGFIVLWQTTMPSVLIEVGFISNPQEERFLMSDQGQSYIASGIFRAVRSYKESIERRSRTLASASPGKSNVMSASASDSLGDDETFMENRIGFRVQVSSSGNLISLDSEYFKGLDDIEVYESDGLYKYVTGYASSIEEITEKRREINELFPDAFIVGVKNGQLIPLQEALRALEALE